MDVLDRMDESGGQNGTGKLEDRYTSTLEELNPFSVLDLNPSGRGASLAYSFSNSRKIFRITRTSKFVIKKGMLMFLDCLISKIKQSSDLPGATNCLQKQTWVGILGTNPHRYNSSNQLQSKSLYFIMIN